MICWYCAGPVPEECVGVWDEPQFCSAQCWADYWDPVFNPEGLTGDTRER